MEYKLHVSVTLAEKTGSGAIRVGRRRSMHRAANCSTATCSKTNTWQKNIKENQSTTRFAPNYANQLAVHMRVGPQEDRLPQMIPGYPKPIVHASTSFFNATTSTSSFRPASKSFNFLPFSF